MGDTEIRRPILPKNTQRPITDDTIMIIAMAITNHETPYYLSKQIDRKPKEIKDICLNCTQELYRQMVACSIYRYRAEHYKWLLKIFLGCEDKKRYIMKKVKGE